MGTCFQIGIGIRMGESLIHERLAPKWRKQAENGIVHERLSHTHIADLTFGGKFTILGLLIPTSMKSIVISVLLLISSVVLAGTKPAVDQTVAIKSFKGRVMLTPLGNGTIEVRIRTWRTTRDTIKGQTVFPVLVNGHKQQFYCGRFGASRIPMLIFAVSDPDRTGESRCLAYQIAPNGALIGQQVVVDDAEVHAHTDQVTSGRFQLAAIDPQVGAIYSIAYQEAHFEGYFLSYEKMRVRQWDATINCFIESDQGFLRDTKGRLVQASRYLQWPDRQREAVFAANVAALPHYVVHSATPKQPTSAQK
jgi:hypothetical protein